MLWAVGSALLPVVWMSSQVLEVMGETKGSGVVD